MSVTLRSFILFFLCCHAAYTGICQQVATNTPHFIGPTNNLDAVPFTVKPIPIATPDEPVKAAVAALGKVNADVDLEDPLDPVISKYAGLISVEASDINNYPLYRFIDEWYGTRYKWGGEDNTGIDCSGFSQKLYYKVYGTELERTANQQHKSCDRVGDEEAQEGDLVFFRIHHFRVSHVGVYLANGYFVHASRSQGVVISNLESKYWRKRFAGWGRVGHAEHAMESDNAQ